MHLRGKEMAKPKINDKLPLLSLSVLRKEANEMPIEPYEEGYVAKDVVVLVLDRASVEFLDADPTCIDYERIKIKENPLILAVACTEEDGRFRNSHIRLGSFPNRLRQKAMITFKALIGSFGCFQFKRIWALTTPLPWRDEMDIDVIPTE